ncbi:MAG: FlgO family outer membrane protein [Verrucomicrobiia bacterium]
MKFKPCCIIAVAMVAFLATATANAQSMDSEIKTITTKLAKDLAAKGRKKVAALDFTDLQGRPTELGRFLAEQVSVEMVGASEVSVVDRANIKSILAEHKLSEEGLVNPENAKKIGQFAGVDAILIGTVTSLDDGVVLTIKAVATDTAEIVAAGKTKFSKTSEIQQLLTRSVGSTSQAGATVTGTSGRYEEVNNAIVTKDFDTLRVALKTIRRVKGNSNYTNNQGLVCVFELSNRDLSRPLLVAANSIYGQQIRATLIDSSGHKWQPQSVSNDMQGLTHLSASTSYTPTDIVKLLNEKAENCVYGSTITIQPGQSIRATITFWKDRSGQSQEPSTSFQLECELVVGIVESGNSKNYSLVNLMLDKLTVP